MEFCSRKPGTLKKKDHGKVKDMFPLQVRGNLGQSGSGWF